MNEDEDCQPGGGVTPPNSQTSSVEGVFAANKSHPFRIIEQDAISLQSLTSLGRVARILAEGESHRKAASVSALSSSSMDSGSTPSSKNISQFPSNSTLTSDKPLQEPDVIASTKAKSEDLQIPVAPPRRKKKNKGI